MYDEYELDRHIEIQERAEAKAKRVSRLTRFKAYKVHPDDDKNKINNYQSNRSIE